MVEARSIDRPAMAAGHVLGQKLDSIPLGGYRVMLIAVLPLVGFVDGYDLVMTGSLLVLAKQPLHLTPGDIRFLAVASTMMVCVGGFIASAISDHWSRKTVMLIGVAGIALFTLLITLAESAQQLIAVRLLTGLAGGFAVVSPPNCCRRSKTAVHICYGYGIKANIDWKAGLGREWRQYEAIFPALAASRIDQVSLECAGSRVPVELLGLLPGKDVLVGAIDVATQRVEPADEVAATIEAALRFVPADRLYPCTNCGMAPMDRDTAIAKVEALAAGAAFVRRRLG